MKKMRRVLLVLLVSVGIELIAFQGMNFLRLLNPQYGANQQATLNDCEIANWETLADGSLLSGQDPILVLGGLNKKIERLMIRATASVELLYIDIFYINDAHPQYGELFLHCIEVKDNQVVVDINDNVKDLRIDLGDDADVTLYDLSILINPVAVHISISRIIAMVLIYWSGVFLFSLQQMPNYHLVQSGGTNSKESN